MVHSLTRKPEKPKCLDLVMTGDTVEAMDFDRFAFLFQQYKRLEGITT